MTLDELDCEMFTEHNAFKKAYELLCEISIELQNVCELTRSGSAICQDYARLETKDAENRDLEKETKDAKNRGREGGGTRAKELAPLLQEIDTYVAASAEAAECASESLAQLAQVLARHFRKNDQKKVEKS